MRDMGGVVGVAVARAIAEVRAMAEARSMADGISKLEIISCWKRQEIIL